MQEISSFHADYRIFVAGLASVDQKLLCKRWKSAIAEEAVD